MTPHSTTRRTTGRRARFSMLAALTTMTLIGMGTAPAASAAPVGSLAPQVAPRIAPKAVAAAARSVVAPAPTMALRPTVASPVGEFAPQGCTFGTSSAACDLYAMAGSVSILSSPTPTTIWGFSSTGAPKSATDPGPTAPGPVLVVHQGDVVTITLHNVIDGQHVSLALPGQSNISVDSGSGRGDDTTGVLPSDGPRTYSFTASRPGTYLYEAGHTANGARQVAMGLAGALIVLPTSGAPYPLVNDDSVLVLSEIDPALNAAPATFDMRNFHPAYRLINGKPFPSTDPVSTDQGHTVLVRYVNVGSQTHSMSVLGAAQTEVAQDGHPMTYPTTVAAESVNPGMTLDTLVTMPNGPEAKIAVYEAAMHLDNNGQTTADPKQLAFGGMMTFLDTNAPAPSKDEVGPVTAHIAASPNPSNGVGAVTITADLSDATTGGTVVDQAEFVVDDAVTTGVGFGVPMTGNFGSVDVNQVTGTIPAAPEGNTSCTPANGPSPIALSCLAAGKHIIYVRAHDAAGKNPDPTVLAPYGNWGVIGSVVFNLPKTGPQTTNGSLTPALTNGKSDVTVSTTGDDSAAGKIITNAEYFLDTVGADGTGTSLVLNQAAATIVSEDVTIPSSGLSGLSEGVHHIFVHSKDSLGLWGPPLDLPLTLDLTGPKTDAASVAPNPTNGLIGDQANPGYLAISAQFSDLDAGGKAQHKIVGAEAFFNLAAGTSPAPGSGLQLLAVNGAFGADPLHPNVDAAYGLIPLSEFNGLADGDYLVNFRAQDEAGNWGDLFPVKITVDKTAPVLGSPLVASPAITNGATSVALSAPVTEAGSIQTAEYWIGTTDPGVGSGTQVQVSVVGTTLTATVPLAGLISGVQTINLRVVDKAGNWSNAQSTTVTVTPAVQGLLVTPNATTLRLAATLIGPNPLVAAEFWPGTLDPGVGKGQATAFAVANTVVSATIPLSALPKGTTQINLRVKDSTGAWSNVASANVGTRPNGVFSSTFERLGLGGWSDQTGSVSSSTAARIRTVWEPASNRGLKVAVPGASFNRTSFVTDRTPTGEQSYHARFAFNRNTLNSGAAANVLTLFEGRSATGRAFALQFRMSGSQAQLRAVMSKGSSSAWGAWVNIAPGAHRLQIDWTSGLSGAMTLRVDGTAKANLTGNNSLTRLESVRLGVTAGVTTGTGHPSGTAYFDSFTSTRTTMP